MFIDRNYGRLDPKRAQESAQSCRGWHRCAIGAETVQVDMQLPVGEPFDVTICPVQNQPGLTDAAGAANRRDHRCSCRSLAERPREAGQISVTAGEQRRRRGKLARHNRSKPATGLMYMNTAADRACLLHRTSHRRTDFIDNILPGALRTL